MNQLISDDNDTKEMLEECKEEYVYSFDARAALISETRLKMFANLPPFDIEKD